MRSQEDATVVVVSPEEKNAWKSDATRCLACLLSRSRAKRMARCRAREEGQRWRWEEARRFGSSSRWGVDEKKAGRVL